MLATTILGLALQVVAPGQAQSEAPAQTEAEPPAIEAQSEAAAPAEMELVEAETEGEREAGMDAHDAASAIEEEAVETVEPVIVIPRDTPVHLMVVNEVSTKDHAAGHLFLLRVNDPVLVDGREVIPVGATAWGELVEAQSSGNTGKRGKLTAELRYLEYGDHKIPIEGGTSADGKSGKGETILGVLAMGPLGLFAKGNNAKIKAGEKMTAFVAQDVVQDDAG